MTRRLLVNAEYMPPVMDEDDPFEYEVLHERKPRVLWAAKLLTHKECDRIVELALPTFQRSQVAQYNKGSGGKNNDYVDNVRTSSGAWLSRFSDDFAVKKFVTRVSQWSGIPPNHGEDVQVLQYQIGQEYKPHVDYFDPQYYEGYLQNGGQRMASSLCFLSEVAEGGETIFPVPNIRVKPLKGGCVLWYNTFANGTLDDTSLHGGSPVIKGTKYASVQWMRQFVRM